MPIPEKATTIATRQHGVVARHQLLELGVTTGTLGWWVRSGALEMLQAGVYCVPGSTNTLERRAMAAVLAAGPGAALSHEAAAYMWGLRLNLKEKLEVTISVPKERRPSIR